ncbi:vomeronasal type-2 receptor 116-like [Diaphorina citri]|uniref:Vomeronasal type-2 receptor 116-like n=1 Tax=Diaphorina citri TaxID=121845 RepID=A0A3Q0J223_DIACI|nr:vomeronasal type-2 receptor 116-like [Diaphorina citri]
MVEIVKKLRWSYVSIIYEESNYGIKAFEELEVLLAKSSICIAVKEKLVKDSGVAEERAYDDIVTKLMTKPRARGVIVFGSDQEVAGVMRAVRRLNATGSFSWVGSDGWSARGLVSDGSEAEVEGTLSLQPQANPVKGFDDYFLNLTVENNRRNPWFVEFWEDHFRCKYPNSSRTPYNSHYSTECTTHEKLSRDTLAFEKQLQFVSDAVMAFSIALDHMHADLCQGKVGLCDAMRPTKGPELLKYLRKVSFQGLSEDHFKFDKDGDGPARYNIIHFKQIRPGVYQWVQVGEYLEGELRLNMSDRNVRTCMMMTYRYSGGTAKTTTSVSMMAAAMAVTGTNAQLSQQLSSVVTQKCLELEMNNTKNSNCSKSPLLITRSTQTLLLIEDQQEATPPQTNLSYLSPTTPGNPSHLSPTTNASHQSTPVNSTLPSPTVHSNSALTPNNLSLPSTGVHSNTSCIPTPNTPSFASLATPSFPSAAANGGTRLSNENHSSFLVFSRFGAGFCFTVVYAALLTKTNRISRIFNAGKRTAKRPNFITPKSQLMICGGLVSVQVLINGVWMLVSPPRAIHHYPSREDNILVCSSFINASYMIAFGYPIFLIVVCTVYAILTRNIPEAFNESKHIGFTMYTTCVIWLAFVPLYFGTGNHMPLRITTMSVTISLSASVTVACLFSPKVSKVLGGPGCPWARVSLVHNGDHPFLAGVLKGERTIDPRLVPTQEKISKPCGFVSYQLRHVK